MKTSNDSKIFYATVAAAIVLSMGAVYFLSARVHLRSPQVVEAHTEQAPESVYVSIEVEREGKPMVEVEPVLDKHVPEVPDYYLLSYEQPSEPEPVYTHYNIEQGKQDVERILQRGNELESMVTLMEVGVLIDSTLETAKSIADNQKKKTKKKRRKANP